MESKCINVYIKLQSIINLKLSNWFLDEVYLQTYGYEIITTV